MKAGDRVTCVDAAPADCGLVQGECYTLGGYHKAPHGLGEFDDGTDAVTLKETRGVYRATRFEVVK